MSEPKRYRLDPESYLAEHPQGDFVDYQDYARIKAEVERLTKAGDAMAAHIERNDERCYIVLPDGDLRIADWNAAKEGKPRD